MFKNRFLLVLVIVLLALDSLAVSSFRTNAAPSNRPAANDFYQRHPNWTSAAPAAASVYSDYFERHPELIRLSAGPTGASDYFQRHPELTRPLTLGTDSSAFYPRHPGEDRGGARAHRQPGKQQQCGRAVALQKHLRHAREDPLYEIAESQWIGRCRMIFRSS